MIRSLLSKITASLREKIASWRGPELKRINAAHVKRNEKKWDAIGWKAFRYGQNQPGGGTLVKSSGTNACNLSDLTVPPRYARAQWLELYRKGITPQGRCLGLDTLEV